MFRSSKWCFQVNSRISKFMMVFPSLCFQVQNSSFQIHIYLFLVIFFISNLVIVFPSKVSKFVITSFFTSNTRGFKFWSSKVCEGGESCEAYSCRLNFDPPQFLSEINDHVTKTHFWSAFKQIKNLILIQFELIKMDQNKVFEQFINQVIMNCSKT